MTRLGVVGNNQGGTSMRKSNLRMASIICTLLLVCGIVSAQPGSIVTQTKSNVLIDTTRVDEIGVVNKTWPIRCSTTWWEPGSSSTR